jgi:hypothetical protein
MPKPITRVQWENSLRQPAFCELLPVRDYLDNVMVRTSGAFVAGYEAAGINGLYGSDVMRNRTKENLEALIRSLPERSMRLQMRYEIGEGLGDLTDRYKRQLRTEHVILQALDRERISMWRERDEAGEYLTRRLHLYFIWNPEVHHDTPGLEWRRARRSKPRRWGLSADKCIHRSRQEHEALYTEFESLMAGVEAALEATGLSPRRLTDQEMFLEAKRTLNPLGNDVLPYRQGLEYRSARSQVVNVNIEDEQDDHLKIAGFLQTWVTLKDLPDSTFPGLMRELVNLEFPVVVSTEVLIPDQARIVRAYKRRLLRMQAAQRDIHGAFKINIEAQVAQEQLVKTLQDVVASSLRVCQCSVIVGLRTSKPIRSSREREEAEQVLADRRQRVLHAITRMNGARGMTESLAQKRVFIASLPGMADENKREQECLTLHAADLLPVEMPWPGMPNSPAILLETPNRQLAPFSPFDPALANANMLFTSQTGGGKTFFVQMLLMMLARTNALISIIERGDSYRPLVELMGGRVIEVRLDTGETINPWDLPLGETVPSREQVAFLKGLTRHMIGDSPGADTTLIDSVLSQAIEATYKRCSIRYANPTPTFSDLRDELRQWRERDSQRAEDEAKLAAIKLSSWTENGIYSRLFDAQTNIRTSDQWLFFSIEGLGSDPKLETAMSMLIAYAMAGRTSGARGQASITVLDECWSLLDSPVLAPEVVQLFRTARKRNSSVWGVSQTLEDFVGTATQPRPYGPGILKNTFTKFIGHQSGDLDATERQLHLNPVALDAIKRFGAPQKGRHADMLLVIGDQAETTQTIRMVPSPVDYWISTTFPRERAYRSWFLQKEQGRPLFDSYQALASKFPRGLAEAPQLPEELSGEVNAAMAATR